MDRSLPNNSIGMPLHYDMDEPPAPPPGAGASAGVVGRLEGVAFSGYDGCAAYVPLVAATAAGGGELAAAAVEVAALLREAACTKVTVDLKQQLRQVRGACRQPWAVSSVRFARQGRDIALGAFVIL